MRAPGNPHHQEGGLLINKGWSIGFGARRAFLVLALSVLLPALPSFALAALAAPAGREAETAIPLVKGMAVEGTKRIDVSAVRLKMAQQVGEPLQAAVVSDDIKAVFSMGYFEDVLVEVEPFEGGVLLVYRVVEKPTVWSIEHFGNQDISDEKLEEAMTISPGAIADNVLIQDGANALKRVCEDEGYPMASVVPVLNTLREGRVLLTYYIAEGPRVRIRDITFEGNGSIKDRKLRAAMLTSEWWFWHYIAQGGHYQREMLDADAGNIRNLYYDNGFLEVQVERPRTSLTDDRQWMDVHIPVAEGPQYRVSKISYSGNEVFDNAALGAEVAKSGVAEGEVFSKGAVGKSVGALTDMYGEKGYAMAGVMPDVKPDEQEKTADVLYRVREGEKFTIGEVDVTGNIKTKDKVIRREVRLNEGELYNSKLLRRSYQRITNLNFFENVRLTPVPRVEAREMDITIDVEERATGSLMFGVGYSTTDELVVTAEYTQGNVGGGGQTFKLSGEVGNVSSTFDISYTEPWLFDREVSATARLYREDDEYSSYNKNARGGTLGFGKSFKEFWQWYLTYKLEEVEVYDIDDDASNIVWSMEGISLTSSITPALTRSTVDNALDPHTGSKNSLSLTLAGLGGDNKFYRAGVDSNVFIPTSKETTLSLRGRFGQAHGIWGEGLPLYERYFVGGITTMRGFRDIGPVDDEGDYIGGERRIIGNVDFIFPLVPELRLKGAVFFDAGNAFDDFEDLDVRCSTGLGVRWISPIGPIRLEYGLILDRKEDEPAGRWEFTMGTFF